MQQPHCTPQSLISEPQADEAGRWAVPSTETSSRWLVLPFSYNGTPSHQPFYPAHYQLLLPTYDRYCEDIYRIRIGLAVLPACEKAQPIVLIGMASN